MGITELQFNRVITHLNQGRTVNDVAFLNNLSERQVRRIKEAGTWENWPYIVAKTTHGYMTPEYKQYLNRRGLPLMRRVSMENPSKEPVVYIHITNKPWWKRLLRVK